MILRADQIRAWDAFTIAQEPIKSIDLMDRAAFACYQWFEKRNFSTDYFQIFCGTGNNGGDGLALAIMLLRAGASVEVYVLNNGKKASADFLVYLNRWKEFTKRDINWLNSPDDFPFPVTNGVIIDALFGSGLNRPLEGLNALLIDYLNEKAGTVVSIDLPSGLLADNLVLDSPVIQASFTVSFQVPKLAFFFSENEKYTGEVYMLDIGLHPGFLENLTPAYELISVVSVSSMYRPRNRFSHKGTFGHALLIAGSFGKTGAALLAARACMHSGVGLLTVGAPRCAYLSLQIGVPEAMVLSDSNRKKINSLEPDYNNYQAVGIGPGLGTAPSTRKWLIKQLSVIQCPLVLDADALNAIAIEEKLPCIPKNAILTPHPKEFDRLFGACLHSQERMEKAIQKAKDLSCIIVLKGHRTLVVSAKGEAWINTTGNAGMATGGSGDVLTGVLTGLLAQGYTPLNAALLGVWLHGKAGDLAEIEVGKEALIASQMIRYVGKAFLSIAHA
jgi:NAD(P)H-hydrate epimerase